MKGIYMVIPLYKLRIFAYLFRIVYELPQQHTILLNNVQENLYTINLLSWNSHVNSHIHDLNYLNTLQIQSFYKGIRIEFPTPIIYFWGIRI